MKILNAKVIPLLQLLRSLDGSEKGLPDGRVIKEPYRFASGKVYLDIALNQNRLASQAEAIEKARVAIIKSLLPEGETELKPDRHQPQMAEFVRQYQAVLDEEADIDLRTMKASDLNLDANPISPTILAALGETVLDLTQ